MDDLSDFFKEGSAGPVSLDWLDVDEKKYREADTLPKQNLDVVPELKAQWSHEDSSPLAYFVPNREIARYPRDPGIEAAPNTTSDLSETHGPIRKGQPPRPSMPRSFSGQSNAGAIIPAQRLLRKATDVQAQEEALQEAKARPVVAMMRREMLKGRGAEEVAKSIRMAFDPRDLKATQQYWAPLFKEAGLYGAVYSTQDSFSDCHEGANFLSKHASKARVIVAGDKCGSCIYNKVGSCTLYGKKLVASADEVLTSATVTSVLDEHRMSGKISSVAASQNFGGSPRVALKNIHKTATTGSPVDKVEQPRMGHLQGYYSTSRSHVASDMAKRDIVKTASQYLNEGLYGDQLDKALQGRFDPRDIQASSEELRVLAAEQGLQGIYFIDPAAYNDYGRGCVTAQQKHRSRAAVKYAKLGDKCGSCVHQKMAGVCSVLNKKLVNEVPYENKAAQQQTVLASGASMEIDPASLIRDRSNILQEFQMTAGAVDFELNPPGQSLEASIEFGHNVVDAAGNNVADEPKL